MPLVHNLDFDDSMLFSPGKQTLESVYRFLDFVDKTLVSLRDSPIKKFSLTLLSPVDEPRYNRQMYNVLQRGVPELSLSTAVFTAIEPEFFFSRTLVKLTLSDGCYGQDNIPPGGVLFPALKSLSFLQVCFDAFPGADLHESLLSSPLLEEFNIRDDDPRQPGWTRQVTCSSIKRASIFYHSHDLEDYSCVFLDTPNLVYLDYSSYVAEDYDLQLDSLVEARLDLMLWK